ncbi:MAG: lipoate--protein ligase family protein [Candidatus Diapherotrites archaeon]|nr:lipoate--protein ligase family protein [Candidatus Diapherotrites archaeon]
MDKTPEWRVIPLEEHDAYLNMALDEACAQSLTDGDANPTIRFYRWKPSAVSIGYFQSMEEEVNVEQCKELGIDLVRRRTGGGAVYHDYEGEVTYSVIAPEQYFPKGITESYHLICGWITNGLKELGLHAEFKPINDITLNGKKISGNAQTRRNGILTQHGTILYDLDVRKMFSVLKVSKEKISDKMIQSVEERVTRILDHKKVSREDVAHALLKGFTQGKFYSFGKWSNAELDDAHVLVSQRYCTKEWNWMR